VRRSNRSPRLARDWVRAAKMRSPRSLPDCVCVTPTASQGEIVNYLVTGYCQKIKANSALNRDGKQDELRAFADRVGQIAGKR
jgi:hypothetical protein